MLKNIIKVLFSNILITFIGLVNSFVFPIILSIEGYAQYHEFTLYVSYINICHLGIASGMFLNYAGKDYKKIDRALYKSEVLLIYFVLTIFTVIGLVLGFSTSQNLIIRVALAIFPVCILGSYKSLYQSWNRFTGYSIVNFLGPFLLTAGVIVFYFVNGALGGDHVIIIYLIVQYILAIWFIFEFILYTKGVKSKFIFSKENMITLKNGFLLMIGNYVSLIFHALDKQVINIFYSVYSFSMYSFAMSTNSIMSVVITALANPFYPRLAKGDIDKKFMNYLKEMLLIFGAFSGCAYFVVEFLVRNFITKYEPSLIAVSIFFAAFPAMAVINVIYVNMYRVTKQLIRYIFTLVGMCVVALSFNMIAVWLKGDYIGVSIATLVVYYVWLFYSQRDFADITITIRDVFFLCAMLSSYFISIFVLKGILGFIFYTVSIVAIDFIFYSKSILETIQMFTKKFMKRKQK